MSKKMIICDSCSGRGQVTEIIGNRGYGIHCIPVYQWTKCPRCDGDRVIYKVKTITYERVPADE